MNLPPSGQVLAAASLSLGLLLPSSPSRGAIELVGTTQATFDWAPASGTITHYGVYVSYDGDEFPAAPDVIVPPSRPFVTLEASYGEAIEIRVAAFNGGLRGPFSEISDSVAFLEPMQVHRALGAQYGPMDLNGDGWDDIVYVDPQAEVLRARVMGQFHAGPTTLAPLRDGPWQLLARGDYDGDGRGDLFWRNLHTGENRIWFFDGLVYEESPTWPMPAPSWRVLASADFDGDARADVLWHHVDRGSTLVWIAGDSPTGHVFVRIATLPAVGDAGWQVDACGDFDRDGDSDLFWSRRGADHRIWLVDLASQPGAEELVAAPPPAPEYRVRAVGDFDADGHDELLWRNAEDGWTVMRHMTRSAPYQDDYLQWIGTEWLLGSVGDLDWDPNSELVWSREDGAIRIWNLSGANVTRDAIY